MQQIDRAVFRRLDQQMRFDVGDGFCHARFVTETGLILSIRSAIAAHGIVLIVEFGRPKYCFQITSADGEQRGGEYDGKSEISTDLRRPRPSLIRSKTASIRDRSVTGIKKFLQGKVAGDIESLYSESELQALAALSGTPRDVEARMPVKITQHYFELAKDSLPLQTLVKASPKETGDLEGAADPGKQMDYSPVEGLIHKYELGLIYVALTCSSHCRFCYREELIAKKEVERPDGTIAPKGLAQIGEIAAYVQQHNEQVAQNGGRHPDTGREKLREILMSGGDPMVLSNKNIAGWWSALADAGVESIRLGTKELAFYPDRFDATFFDMVDKFHAAYPGTRIRFMVHFNHPG